jgi:hypothetical protein
MLLKSNAAMSETTSLRNGKEGASTGLGMNMSQSARKARGGQITSRRRMGRTKARADTVRTTMATVKTATAAVTIKIMADTVKIMEATVKTTATTANLQPNPIRNHTPERAL